MASVTPWGGSAKGGAVLLSLLLGGALPALAILLSASLPALAGGPPEPIAGDLLVLAGETQLLENRTLVVSGNVTVQGGGTLELRNSTILIDATANGSRALTVESGGTLRIVDLDGAQQTAFDRSQVAAADARFRFLAHFKPGSNVLVRNSAMSGFGFALVTPGLFIETDNATFSGAALDAYEYLRVEGASPTFEATTLTGDGTGSDYFFRSNSTLSNCTLSGHFVALSANDGSTVSLTGALIRDSAFALAANGSQVRVRDSAVNNSSSGVFLTNASVAALADVDFDPALVSFGDIASFLESSRSFTFAVINNASEPVRNATVTVRDGSNATVASGNSAGVGSVGPWGLRAFTVNASGRFDDANYTATAQRPSLSAAYSFAAATEASRVVLNLAANIDPRLTLISPAPGAVLLANLSELFEVNATDPDATPGGITVSWRSSIDGALGSGSSLPVALSPGVHTMEVEARDTADGFRRLTFNVTAEPGRAETYSATDSAGLVYRATIWKTSVGAFGVTTAAPPQAPPLAVGLAADVHAVSGSAVWAFATVELPFDPASLPYGTFAENLTLMHLVGGSWRVVPGGTVDLNRSTLTANVSRADGLGWFLLVAQKGPNLPPAFAPLPTLSAVVGNAFLFDIHAVDTPGDTVAYALLSAPAWLSIGADTGTLSGTPTAADRGLATLTVQATDPLNASATVELHVFVSGTAENRPPSLLNPITIPARPSDRETVTLQVTYLDPDGDLPLFIEVVIDGTAHAMDPVDLFDINTTHGKAYLFRAQLTAGAHDMSFRASDGAPGNPIQTLSGPPLVVESDTVRALNNWFLALFASIAATLALVLYVRSRAPKAAPAAPKEIPEDRVAYLEGEALKPIAPQPPMVKKPAARAEELEREAELRAREAAQDEAEAKAKLGEASRPK